MQIDIMQSRQFSRNLAAEQPLMRCGGLRPQPEGTGQGAGRDCAPGPRRQGGACPEVDASASGELPKRLSINGFV